MTGETGLGQSQRQLCWYRAAAAAWSWATLRFVAFLITLICIYLFLGGFFNRKTLKKCCFSPLSLNKVKNKKGSPNSKCQKALCFFCKTEFLLSDSPNLLTGRRKAGRPYDGSGKKKRRKKGKERKPERRKTNSLLHWMQLNSQERCCCHEWGLGPGYLRCWGAALLPCPTTSPSIGGGPDSPHYSEIINKSSPSSI